MKLVGSTTSPFVRKVRLILAEQGYVEERDYEFETLKALSPEGAKVLATYGPIRRIPILIDEDKCVFDSSIISEYLLEKKGQRLSVDEKLGLRMIDELCDSGILLFQQKLWGIDPEWKNELSIRMYGRVQAILSVLENSFAQDSAFASDPGRVSLSELQKDWLYCVLDWFQFRSVVDFGDGRPGLLRFKEASAQLEKFKPTALYI